MFSQLSYAKIKIECLLATLKKVSANLPSVFPVVMVNTTG